MNGLRCSKSIIGPNSFCLHLVRWETRRNIYRSHLVCSPREGKSAIDLDLQLGSNTGDEHTLFTEGEIHDVHR